MELLTESRIKTFRRCQREHLIRYVMGYSPSVDRLALRFGTLAHAGLEAWWKEPVTEMRLAAAIEAVTDSAGDDFDPYELAKLEEMMRGYDARWGDEAYTTLAVEAEFNTPLVNPETGAASKTFRRAGKLDAVARDARGRVVFVEHKTSGVDIGPGSTYWARLKLDGQVSGYFIGADALGFKAEACIYDVLGKPRLKPLQANSRRADAETPAEYGERVREEIANNPDRYYQRGEVVRLEAEMRAFDSETWALANSMREGRRLMVAPRNPDACERYGSLCSFFSVCCGEASLEDPGSFKKSDDVHPELNGASVAT